MYAIVQIAGVQVKAAPDAVLDVPLLPFEVGARVEFPDVLLVSDGGTVRIGQPKLANAKVAAEILEHGRGPKIIVGTFKRRKDSRKRKGHRQDFTRIRVTAISA